MEIESEESAANRAQGAQGAEGVQPTEAEATAESVVAPMYSCYSESTNLVDLSFKAPPVSGSEAPVHQRNYILSINEKFLASYHQIL